MFDPLVAKRPASQQNYPDSYWANTTHLDQQSHQLQQDISTEVAIIGGGYTGLSCAYHLAAEQNIQAVVLEANQFAWGCSGRNAGFVLNGTGRLSLPQIQQKWGLGVAKQVYQEYRAAIDTVSNMIETGKIECDRNQAGYLKLAHKKSLLPGLQQQALALQQTYGDPVEFIPAEQLRQEFLNPTQAHGGLYFPYSYGLHPLKLALGYAKMAKDAGANIFDHSPVIRIEENPQAITLHTPQARVTAKKLVFATNGYSINRFHPVIDHKHFPVLSSVMVTAPLSQAQLQACGIKPGLLVMDTRELKYYYRLLPDNRILFGGRGAIRGKDANHPVYQQRLVKALTASFPPLAGIKAEYFWSGWISVALDDYPRIFQANERMYYSMGYCGSGVSFSTQAGKRLAEKVAGICKQPLPFMQSALPKFPLSPMKRMGLWGFYHWGRFKDQWL